MLIAVILFLVWFANKKTKEAITEKQKSDAVQLTGVSRFAFMGYITAWALMGIKALTGVVLVLPALFIGVILIEIGYILKKYSSPDKENDIIFNIGIVSSVIFAIIYILTLIF